MKVYVSNNDRSVKRMFHEQGWSIADKVTDEIDLACFSGGSDINPHLYGQKLMTRTSPYFPRDDQEIYEWKAVEPDFPKVGICRGAQLGNVLCGGTLWQDVNNHVGNHMMKDLISGEMVNITSLHHQMCILTKEAKIWGVARESTRKVNTLNSISYTNKEANEWEDPEAFVYDNFNFLGVQFHPEYDHVPSTRVFFKYLNKYFKYS